MKELCTITKKRNIFAVCLKETWQNGISTVEDKNCIIFSNELDPKNVKSRCSEQGVSENAATAWRYEGSIVHNDLGARITAVFLVANNNMKNEVEIFFIPAWHAPKRNADQKLWNSVTEKLEIYFS